MVIEVLRKYFPIPSPQAMQAEVGKPFPFVVYGRSGGFGQTRRLLVHAIRQGDRATAERLFLSLAHDSVEEYVECEQENGRVVSYEEAAQQVTFYLLSALIEERGLP